VPELSIHSAGAGAGLFDGTERGFSSDEPPPFWAFLWPGGQALARHILDQAEVVAGRRVLDVAAGGGIAAIAAARAGAAHVRAVDIDPAAIAAIVRNAGANGVTVHAELGDARELRPDGFDVVLAGDVCYAASTARIMLAALRRAARAGAEVLVGDARRGFLPERFFDLVAGYQMRVPAALEDRDRLTAEVWRLRRT
jgi:predicted nicotinamide N-methyase